MQIRTWLIATIFLFTYVFSEGHTLKSNKSGNKSDKSTSKERTGKQDNKASSGEDYYALGLKSMSAKDYATAVRNFEKSKTLYEKSGKDVDAIKVSHKLADAYSKSGKYPKAIKELEEALKRSIAIKNNPLTERSYQLLYEAYQRSGNEKKAAEYYGYYNSFKTNRANRDLQKKDKINQLEINKLKEQKLRTELGKQEAENLLEEQTMRLLQTKDSLALLDLMNKQTQAQIDLLQSEKEVRELKVKEQDAKLKIKELALRKKEAELRSERLVMYGLLLIILMVLALAFVLYRNFQQKQAANAKIEEQLGIIQQQHTNITNSINYAQRIQNAMLPGERALKHLVQDSFILFKPKDIVSGDFYWFYNISEESIHADSEPEPANIRKLIVAAVDCTGHGVPGALMSMIGYNLLNTIVAHNVVESDKILSELHRNVRFALQQHKNDSKDGMDMALCVIDKDARTIEFSGAKNPIVYIQDGELHHIKGDSHTIGGAQGEAKRTYTKHVISIEKPTSFYLFSDGYTDQFGGPESRKFMIKNLKEMLLKIHTLPFDEQKAILDKTIENWKGTKEKQIDDILVLGMKVGG